MDVKFYETDDQAKQLLRVDSLVVKQQQLKIQKQTLLNDLKLTKQKLIELNDSLTQKLPQQTNIAEKKLQYISHHSSAKGRRPTNEDTFIISSKPFFAAVFDGHGGSEIAELAAQFAPEFLFNLTSKLSLQLGFLEFDKFLTSKCEESGSTVGFVCQGKDQLFIGNIGDVRVVTEEFATSDHKPMDEKSRLSQYSSVVIRKRVNGCLATSRALGDRQMKTQGIVALADIISIPSNSEYIFIGCDGVFDILSNDQIRQIIKKEESDDLVVQAAILFSEGKITEGDEIVAQIRGVKQFEIDSEYCEEILQTDEPGLKTCKAIIRMAFRMGSQDNISAILIQKLM